MEDGPSGLRPDRIRLFVGADVSQKAELYGPVYMASNPSSCGLRREPADLNAPKRENPINGKSKPDT
jgi:hypothetical protein